MASRGLGRNNRSLFGRAASSLVFAHISEIRADFDVKGSREFGLAEVLPNNCCVNSIVVASAAKQSGPQHAAPGLLRRKGSSQ
jgi:hypothetical protein